MPRGARRRLDPVQDEGRRRHRRRRPTGPDHPRGDRPGPDAGGRRQPALGRRDGDRLDGARCAPFDPYWIEEPTSPDDILGHAAIARAVAPIRVATGEHVHNRVMFKQFLAAEAMRRLPDRRLPARRRQRGRRGPAAGRQVRRAGLPARRRRRPVRAGPAPRRRSTTSRSAAALDGPDDRVRRPPPRALRGSGGHPRRRATVLPERPGLQRRDAPRVAAAVPLPGRRRVAREAVRPGHPRPAGGDRRVRAAPRRAVARGPRGDRAANIRNYSIYRHGELLFAYFEYVGDDFAADMARMAADPIIQAMVALTDAMQEPYPEREPRRVVADAAGDLPHGLMGLAAVRRSSRLRRLSRRPSPAAGRACRPRRPACRAPGDGGRRCR